MHDLSVASNSAVPQSYAEKAMASLMQLHNELMDEKERRVELYRKLQEREQALAELRLYVQSLEEKVNGTRARAPAPEPRVHTSASVHRVVENEPTPPRPPNVAARAHGDGWKVW